jgi:hypothetical protein
MVQRGQQELKLKGYDWLFSRVVLPAAVCLIGKMYFDVQAIKETMPVMVERIETLKERTDRLENKPSFVSIEAPPAKMEDVITLASLLKTKQ